VPNSWTVEWAEAVGALPMPMAAIAVTATADITVLVIFMVRA
jgi:hypothetical protein